MRQHPFWSLWGGPIVMGLLTTTGLITALVSDTWGDWWSWVGLGIPVGVMGWYCWPRAPLSAKTPQGTGQAQADTCRDVNTHAGTPPYPTGTSTASH